MTISSCFSFSFAISTHHYFRSVSNLYIWLFHHVFHFCLQFPTMGTSLRHRKFLRVTASRSCNIFHLFHRSLHFYILFIFAKHQLDASGRMHFVHFHRQFASVWTRHQPSIYATTFVCLSLSKYSCFVKHRRYRSSRFSLSICLATLDGSALRETLINGSLFRSISYHKSLSLSKNSN